MAIQSGIIEFCWNYNKSKKFYFCCLSNILIHKHLLSYHLRKIFLSLLPMLILTRERLLKRLKKLSPQKKRFYLNLTSSPSYPTQLIGLVIKTPSQPRRRLRNNPGILISGHDLKDLEMLLEQTQGTGVDVYTHSEMLPAHYYPAFKRYPHFVGNYGNAWWKQREEFESFNSPILMTTNCIVPPLENAKYTDRLCTTGTAGLNPKRHIHGEYGQMNSPSDSQKIL